MFERRGSFYRFQPAQRKGKDFYLSHLTQKQRSSIAVNEATSKRKLVSNAITLLFEISMYLPPSWHDLPHQCVSSGHRPSAMFLASHRLLIMKTVHVLPSFVAPTTLLARPSLLSIHSHRRRVIATAARAADDVPTLVIVESPAKALTIQKIVPNHYSVRSCVGHVREIPSSAKRIPAKYKSEPWARLGVDVDNDFRPLYVLIAGKLQIIRELKKELEKSQQLILATDDDREGEAISWHLTEVLKPSVPVKRAVFQEITSEAILHAFSNCRQVDLNLVSAQETRRVLDRLAGYTMSPLLWKKIARGLSAGRVQSVAMSVIVQREIERMRFRSAKYSGALATFTASSTPVTATLSEIDGVRMVKGTDFDDETGELTDAARKNGLTQFTHDSIRELCERLDRHNATVRSVENRETSRHPPAPLITSTLQQECGNRFGFGAGRTMRIAQKLYENGHITYMRTDNPKLSDQAVVSCREAVEQMYGNDFLRDKNAVTRGSKPKASQAAHEAIRPAGSNFKEPHELKDLTDDEQSVYSLIFRRTLASQMSSAKLHSTTIRVEVPVLGDQAVDVVMFKATGTTVVQAGFLKALQDDGVQDKSSFLPVVHEGMAVEFEDVQISDHETKPNPRFNDASLVKVLEDLGVGRPSTYAGIIEKLITRGYIFRGSSLSEEKKVPPRALVPSLTAFAVEKLLACHFPSFVDAEFTARMETALDQIAAGLADRTQFLREYYCGDNGLSAMVSRTENEIEGSAFRQILLPNMPKEMINAAGEEAKRLGLKNASTSSNKKRKPQSVSQETDSAEAAGASSDDWEHTRVLVSSYGPYVERAGKVIASLPKTTLAEELSGARLRQILRIAEEPEIGTDPNTGKAILLKTSRYGPYLQLGSEEDYPEGTKPRRCGLLPGMGVEDVTIDVAAKLLSLPRSLGNHPDSGHEIRAALGPYGPYVVHDNTYVSLRNVETGVLDIDLSGALDLIKAAEYRKKLRQEKQARKLKEAGQGTKSPGRNSLRKGSTRSKVPE